MRLFSAIVPPDEVLDDLDRELARIRARHVEDPGLRWIPRSSWHVTLCFYGEDDPEDRAEWLARRLSGQESRPLAIEGAGTFPGVLWARVAGDLGALAAAAGAESEGRPYHAHLTLARWRRPTGRGPGKPWAQALADFRGVPWQANEVVLMRSLLSRAGARYTVLHRYALGG